MSTFRTAFDHHLTSIRSPDEPESTMQLEHIVTLVDDMISKEELEEAVVVIRRGQRWLQGRGDQVQYDTLEDDREYDPPGVTRDGGSEPVRDSEDNEGFPMGTPLRHRLALLRLRLGDDNEAMVGRSCGPLLTVPDSHRRDPQSRRYAIPRPVLGDWKCAAKARNVGKGSRLSCGHPRV